MKKLSDLLFVFLCIVSISSCSNENNNINGDSSIIARGVVNKKAESPLKESLTTVSPIAFTGKDIAWFNMKTREIKFRDTKIPELCDVYQKINFEIEDAYLFSAATIASDVQSFICYDLVLFYNIEDNRYFLLDGYPDFIIDNEETKKNILNRAEGWKQFLIQLEKENKLRKK